MAGRAALVSLALVGWPAQAQTPAGGARRDGARRGPCRGARVQPRDRRRPLRRGAAAPRCRGRLGSRHGVRRKIAGRGVRAGLRDGARSRVGRDRCASPRRIDDHRRGRGIGSGVSVALDAGGKTTWVAAVAPRAVPVLDEAASAGNAGNVGKLDQLSSSADLPMMTAALDGATPMPADPSAIVTWTWLLPTSAIGVSTSARPVVTVIYTDLLGLSSADVSPVLVRLMPIGTGWRLVATARGRADEPVREEADWSVGRTLAEVAGVQSEGGGGLMKIRLARALPPGDYAVILRPVTSRALAGERVFAGSALAAGEGIVFGAAWPFHVR